MRRVSTILSVAVLCLGLGSELSAQHAARKIVAGAEVEKRTESLMKDLEWSRDFKELEKRAEKENKLMFWVQIVGDLDGGL